MSEKSAKARDAERKAAGAKIHACFEGSLTHIRAGSWNGLEGADVTFIGRPQELHGSVCTCCKGSVNYRRNDV